MKIALPVENNSLCLHFGHCENFQLFDIENGGIKKIETVKAPPHEPGLLPRWLFDKDVNIVIAGGMGQKAIKLFQDQHIQVIVGAPISESSSLVKLFLAGELKVSENVCDH